MWIAMLPLGRDRAVSSGSQVAFHVAWKGMSRMGVSSSSGCMRARCSGVKPLSTCWQRCLAERWSVLSCLTWYIVLCRSVLWSVISVMCSGAGFDASGVGGVSGICVEGCLFGLTFAVFIRLAYEFGLCEGRLSGVINFIQEVCMVVSRGVVSLGSFLCSVVDGRSRVALRVSRDVRRAVLGPVLSPFGSLAMSTFVGEMCNV